MRTISKRRKQVSRGDVMLESALIFIVFFCMLLGTFDFGQFLYIHQALVERARWAAREGVAGQYTSDQTRNLVLYGTTTAGTTGYFDLDTTMVTVTTFNAGTDSARLEVKLFNYPYKMLSPYLAGTYSGPNILIEIPEGFYN